MDSKNAAVLWTGGKDSALAFYEGTEAGYKITHLITFVPRNPNFVAHPLQIMKQQAQCIGLPHLTVEISEPMKEGYEKAISYLKTKHRINTIITGDIAEVDCQPNWIRERSKYSAMNVYAPLWGLDRDRLIARLLTLNFQVVFTCVKKPWFSSRWAGNRLTKDSWKRLQNKHTKTGLDVCGENGEFHTMVLDAPYFIKSIEIKDAVVEENESMTYLKIQKSTIKNKSGRFRHIS